MVTANGKLLKYRKKLLELSISGVMVTIDIYSYERFGPKIWYLNLTSWKSKIIQNNSEERELNIISI